MPELAHFKGDILARSSTSVLRGNAQAPSSMHAPDLGYGGSALRHLSVVLSAPEWGFLVDLAYLRSSKAPHLITFTPSFLAHRQSYSLTTILTLLRSLQYRGLVRKHVIKHRFKSSTAYEVVPRSNLTARQLEALGMPTHAEFRDLDNLTFRRSHPPTEPVDVEAMMEKNQ